jgi:hypothetical protein
MIKGLPDSFDRMIAKHDMIEQNIQIQSDALAAINQADLMNLIQSGTSQQCTMCS